MDSISFSMGSPTGNSQLKVGDGYVASVRPNAPGSAAGRAADRPLQPVVTPLVGRSYSRTYSPNTIRQMRAAHNDKMALSSPQSDRMPPVSTLELRNSRSGFFLLMRFFSSWTFWS